MFVYQCRVCRQHLDLDECRQLIAKDRHTDESLTRYECPSCQTIFGPLSYLLSSDEEMKELYKNHHEYDDCVCSIFQLFLLYPMRKEWKYLDYGCGTGRFVDLMSEEGYDIHGYDPFIPRFSDPPASETFDCILSCNVIEHWRDPIKECTQMIRFLRPGGLLCLTTPCFGYRYFHIRQHLHFFSDTSFQNVAKYCNLVLLQSIFLSRELLCKIFVKL